MAFSPPLSMPISLFLTALIIYLSTVNAGGNHEFMGWIPAPNNHCEGSIGGCMPISDFNWDAELNRRVLATSQYISYAALQRNSVPCSRRGASYYNCRPGAEANPYTHGCLAIARCRN